MCTGIHDLARILKDEPRKPLFREGCYFLSLQNNHRAFTREIVFLCVLFSLHKIPCNTVAEHTSIPR